MKTVTLFIAGIFWVAPGSLEAQNATVQWFALSSGFAVTSVQSGRMLTMSAGQPFVEVSSGPNHIVESGFLAHPVLRDILVSVPQQGELPLAFNLDQNYPNPFNPSTKISFTVPMRGFVELKVYDMLGREVATLAGENLPAGSYERVFDATGLASGVYFYRLSTTNFVHTKKLVLLH